MLNYGRNLSLASFFGDVMNSFETDLRRAVFSFRFS